MFLFIYGSFVALCTHMHVFNTSVWPSSLSGLLGHDSVPLTGKFGVADTFAGLFKLLTSLCMHACVSYAYASVWSLGLFGFPMRSFMLLADRSGVADVFTGLFELLPTPWTCVRVLCMSGQLLNSSASSGHDLVLPVGEFGSLGSPGLY